ncbi:Beige protein-like 1 [Rhodotorula kratochvilovae]
MLRRLSEASSFLSRPSPPPNPADAPPVPPLPTSDSSHSLASPALTEALSYDLVTSPQPERVAHAREDLRQALEDLQQASPSNLETRLSALATIQLVLQEHDVRDVQSAFGTLGGFEVVVGALASLDSAPRHELAEQRDGEMSDDRADSSLILPEDDLRYHLATLIFHVLHLALRLPANSDALSFSALASALDLSGLIGKDASVDEKARAFSLLWAFLVGDFSEGAGAVLVVRSKVLELLQPNSDHADDAQLGVLAAVRDVVAARRREGQPEEAAHPAVVPLLLDLLEAKLDPTADPEAQLRLVVLALVASLLDRRAGERSVVRLSDAGLLRLALARALPTANEGAEGIGGDEKDLWKEIVRALLGSMGARGQDAKRLFDAVGARKEVDESVLQLILDTLPTSRSPPVVEFEFSHSSSSSLSLRSLGRPFPPPTHGYTFLAWINVACPPTFSPLIIFGATDPSSKTFFEFTLTSSLHFAIQTTLRTPPVEFGAFTLSTGSFHHVALVHQRPKFVSQSSALLYIDGLLVDTVKLAYPAAPPKDWDVHAWLGTPAERAAAPPVSSGEKHAAPRWMLGPSWLVHGELQEEFVQVCFRLGPRYAGNFQDVLGRFLTNASASAINVRLDALSRDPSAARSSAVASAPLMYALRHKGAAVIPEHRLYFSLSAANLLAPSPGAAETVKLAAASKGAAIVNAAVPAKLEDVVVRLNGLAVVEGATVVRPRGLDDALWATGGTTMLLGWVEKAATGKQLELAVRVFVEALRDSWRLSEEAEERHAYEILALLLRRKASLVTAVVHDALLDFAGFNLASPGQSVVANTLAFQHLILDFALWKEMDSSIQWAHFDRLRELITTSDAAEYNLKKLNKLHVVRKVVTAIRSRLFDVALIDEVVDFLMLAVRAAFTTDTIRYLATYLAAALTTDPTKGKAAATEEDDSTFILDARSLSGAAHRAPLRVLQHLHDILLDPAQSVALSKWAKHIRTKWALALLQDRKTPPLAAVFVLRILVRLLQTQGPAYLAKFANSDSGFSILRAALPRFWNLGQLHLALFALLHEHDVATIPLDAPFQASVLLASSGKAIAAAPEIVRIAIAMVGRALKALDAPQAQGAEDDEPPQASANDINTGFGVVVELLAQAGRAVADDGDWPLLSSPVALADLIHVLKPVLRLPSSPEYPPTADIPPLPILSPANGFSPFSKTLGGEPAPSTSGSPSLSLQIPSTANGHAGEPTPLTALDISAVPLEAGTTSPAATLVLDLLAQQITHGITTRHVRQTSSLTPTLAQFPSSDPSLQPLRLILDAGASTDARGQVVFRTLLVKEVLHRLSRASTSPVVAARLAALIEVATSFALQGWIADVPNLLSFVLTYLEKLLDETALVASPVRAAPVDGFFGSMNRLALLGLLDPTHIAATLDLLAHHQLAAFSPQNEDTEKVHLLIRRLVQLVRTPEHAAAATHAFKLLALQRAQDVEVAFGQEKRHESEVSFVARLIETDDSQLPTVLSEYDEQLARLDPAWDAFLAEESKRARIAVDLELKRMDDLAAALKQKRDSHRRRLRKRRHSISDWRSSVQEQDAARAAHARQDRSEHNERISAEWKQQLTSSRPQPPLGTPGVRVSLDFTEGPQRQRKKLLIEPLDSAAQTAHEEAAPATPVIHDAPDSPEDPHEPNAQPEDEVVEEDKQRKIIRLLEPGDDFQAVYNVAIIRGVDSYPALLLVGRRNLYLVDGYHHTASGEVVDSWEAPEEERDLHLQTLADLAGRNTRSPSLNAHVSRRWAWSDLTEVHERRFLFRNCALELFFDDGQGFFLTFSGERQAEALGDLADKNPQAVASGSLNFSDSSFGAKLGDAFLGQRTKLERMTKRWEQRQVSNFEYLMYLNTLAGRSLNDLTCYPVMPWVLADYDSETLDLENGKTFRDLTKPMGCQTEERMREFTERYEQLAELGDDGPPPFHYGTHYTSAMIVTGYLIRLAPFTEAYLDLQGGSFDHADRLFWSIKRAWESASAQNRSDVRELTPEFFYLPEFLKNVNGHDLGKRQESDEPIDDVVLPPWAKGDPRVFVEQHREALESEYVSTHLHAWIDLVFGFKQRGEAAVEAVNVFSALSYEGAIDLDAVTDPDERKAACSTINNFGQTPRQLFAKPHPARRARLKPKATHALFAPDLPIELAVSTLVQCISPIVSLDSGVAISSITGPPSSSMPDKIRFEHPHILSVPHAAGLTLQYGFSDGTLRFFEKGVTVPVALQEGGHSGKISAACFADRATLVTGSVDSSIVIWRFELRTQGNHKHVDLTKLATLRGGHSTAILSLVASKAFSIVVSGDEAGGAMLWDLNRLRPVRVLEGHEEVVQAVSISASTGDIATCSGSTLRVWTVNGVLLAEQSTGSAAQPVTALAWSKSETAPILATTHANGRISIFKRVFSSSSSTGWTLELVNTLRLEDRLSPADPSSSRRARRSLPPQDGETITALSFTSRTLYAGTASGKVHLFNPPPTELFLPDAGSAACMACGSKFTLLETRRRCAACAGVFCSLDVTRSVEAGGRFCGECFSTLSPLLVQ